MSFRLRLQLSSSGQLILLEQTQQQKESLKNLVQILWKSIKNCVQNKRGVIDREKIKPTRSISMNPRVFSGYQSHKKNSPYISTTIPCIQVTEHFWFKKKDNYSQKKNIVNWVFEVSFPWSLTIWRIWFIERSSDNKIKRKTLIQRISATE